MPSKSSAGETGSLEWDHNLAHRASALRPSLQMACDDPANDLAVGEADIDQTEGEKGAKAKLNKEPLTFPPPQ